MNAIFLDRDGTIIVDKHYQYKPEEIEYFPDTFKALRVIQDKGYEIFLVTNQSGVGRGYFTMKDVKKMHDAINKDLRINNLEEFVDIKVCPDHPNQPNTFRKPSPKMLNELIQEYDIDIYTAWMVGDNTTDAEAGKNAHINAAIVYKENNSNYPFFKTLLDFAKNLEPM